MGRGFEELDAGSNFDLLVLHITGVDAAGHSTGSFSSVLERKIQDNERVIEQIIEKMDDETTLVIGGDHGMTPDGNHGGSTFLEMKTAFFAYQKKPFPMGKKYRAMLQHFAEMDSNMNQVDATSIMSMLTNTPFPFSNAGIGHPFFGKTDNLEDTMK